MTEQEVAIFYDLFIRNGYVLNFYDRNSFDIVTQKSIGIPLCEKYQKSAVKALMSFLCNDATSDEKETLLFDLFDYYEKQACYKGERESTDVWGDGTLILRDEEYGAKYDVCRKIVDKLCNNSNPTKDSAEYLIAEFSDTYLSQQIAKMEIEVSEDPTAAIGLAKNLIESCCKTILDNSHVKRNQSWDMPTLFSKTCKSITFVPDNVTSKKEAVESVNTILEHLKDLVSAIAKLRNYFGNGHGKAATYIGLETHHARFAVNSSITIVRFLWDCYKEGSTIET